MAGMPPQFMKSAASGPPASGNPFAKKDATKTPLDAKKKKSRGDAIESMQKQDAMLDKKLGANDPADPPMKMPMKMPMKGMY